MDSGSGTMMSHPPFRRCRRGANRTRGKIIGRTGSREMLARSRAPSEKTMRPRWKKGDCHGSLRSSATTSNHDRNHNVAETTRRMRVRFAEEAELLSFAVRRASERASERFGIINTLY